MSFCLACITIHSISSSPHPSQENMCHAYIPLSGLGSPLALEHACRCSQPSQEFHTATHAKLARISTIPSRPTTNPSIQSPTSPDPRGRGRLLQPFLYKPRRSHHPNPTPQQSSGTREKGRRARKLSHSRTAATAS